MPVPAKYLRTLKEAIVYVSNIKVTSKADQRNWLVNLEVPNLQEVEHFSLKNLNRKRFEIRKLAEFIGKEILDRQQKESC